MTASACSSTTRLCALSWPGPCRAPDGRNAARTQLLNCIMDMVEKTRRSLTVLRRCQEADREELNHWIRRYSDSEDGKKGSAPARPLSSSGPEGSQLGGQWGGRAGATGAPASRGAGGGA